MATIGFHASHEQFAPSELLKLVAMAEDAGFGAAMSSDHITPWSERQGQAGFAYAWLGAALQATRRLRFGTLAIPSGWRYHPAVVAHAGATLAEMFPERFRWMAFGSGEAANEQITGDRWPAKPERNARLLAGAEIVRALWRGETVTRDQPIRVEQAKLYTRPSTPPLIVGAALSAETAGWVGGWADGLITVNQPRERLQTMLDAFRSGGGEGKRLLLQVHISYAPTDDEARANAFDQWRSNAVAAPLAESLRTPAEFDAAARYVRPEDLDAHVLISSDLSRHRDWIEEFHQLGFEEIYLHNVGRNQAEFIAAFGKSVLPTLPNPPQGKLR